ncbi:MAG TPA: hypothetical protein VFB31_02780 [Pseudolabrys sp.]|nr:hypothetical protein [Pseudolabrys sp.]
MLRTVMLCAAFAAALAAARPAVAFSLVSLEPSEREHMLSACNRLPNNDKPLCREVVDDHKVIANYKRSCLEAMTLMLKGSTWAMVKSLPATATCRQGLAQAGYPVKDILRRLAGGQ